jgi:hypothetical protein
MSHKTTGGNQAGRIKNPTLGEFLWGWTPPMRLIETESPEADMTTQGEPMDMIEQDAPSERRGPLRLALLRYPEGETPIERGPNRVWR